MKRYIYITIILMTALMSSCGANATTGTETEVLISTTLGDITIKLYDDTPLHRDNFMKLVGENFYDSIQFHRIIRDFMVQTGDPESKTAKHSQPLGAGGPGYNIPAEILFPAHYHKYGALAAARQADQVNPERQSSGSQFYIVTGKKYKEAELKQMEQQLQEQQLQSVFQNLCIQNRDTIIKLQDANDRQGIKALQDKLIGETEQIVAKDGALKFTPEMIETYKTVGGTPFLDNQYTVFGEVVSGMDIVEKIQKVATDSNDRPFKEVRITSMKITK